MWVGNFSGRPMEGVSGVSGAGPLLHRAVLATADAVPPGVLPTPGVRRRRARHHLPRCRGSARGPDCPHATEWFMPGTAPTRACDWHQNGRLVLPAEYAEWQQQTQGPAASVVRRTGSDTARSDGRLHILSPRAGDRYRVPPGVDPRYATVALRAAGGDPSEPVTWYVDGERLARARWALSAGAHVVRAQRAGEREEVSVEVAP